MEILKELFLSQKQRDALQVREDNRKKEYWSKEAEQEVQVRFYMGSTWLFISGTPVLQVTNETDLSKSTIALQQLSDFIAHTRASFVMSHLNCPRI